MEIEKVVEVEGAAEKVCETEKVAGAEEVAGSEELWAAEEVAGAFGPAPGRMYPGVSVHVSSVAYSDQPDWMMNGRRKSPFQPGRLVSDKSGRFLQKFQFL